MADGGSFSNRLQLTNPTISNHAREKKRMKGFEGEKSRFGEAI